MQKKRSGCHLFGRPFLSFHGNIIRKQPSSKLKISTVYHKHRHNYSHAADHRNDIYDICYLGQEGVVDVEFNILKAEINVQQEGLMVLDKTNVHEGIRYLKDMGVNVKKVSAGIRRDDEKCFQCGACTGICPTGALNIQRPDMAVLFEPDKCSGCGLFVAVCPVRAMAVCLEQPTTLPA